MEGPWCKNFTPLNFFMRSFYNAEISRYTVCDITIVIDAYTQLHKIPEDADSRQQFLRLSQSHEELRNAGVTFADPPPGKEEKQAKKPGFISRIFKRRTATPTLRKQSKWGRNRDSTVSESALMTTSKSMPEIAREST